ncbi:PKD domain-containing protein [Candidatus Halobeggiatoa sp. HSG11]|nr:PKD domain-containing protein [Candidatus Halobeggiatoa sp. HSG11]
MLFNIYSRNFSVWRGVLFVVLVVGLMAMGRGAWAFSCDEVTEISKVECESLLQLYDSTDGDNWKNNDGWKVTNTPCSWYGISCWNDSIYQIYLNNNQLTNEIPNFNSLSNLYGLFLADNQLTNAIPDFSTLTKLEYLDLRNNYSICKDTNIDYSSWSIKQADHNPNTVTWQEELDEFSNCSTIPVASFTVTPNKGIAPLTVTVDSSNSYDPNGNIIDLRWNSNSYNLDGYEVSSSWYFPTSIEQGLLHEFVFYYVGTHTITLTVTDNDGATATTQETVTVTGEDVIPPISPDQGADNGIIIIPGNPPVPGDADDGIIIIPGNPPVPGISKNQLILVEKFGNGKVISDPTGIDCGTTCGSSYPQDTNSINLTAIPDSGYYFVEWGKNCAGTNNTITITMESGETKTCTATFNKENQTPTANFTATPNNGQTPLMVNLDASDSDDSDGNIVSWQWTSSTGQSSSGETTTLTLTSIGTHTIILTVTDSEGLIDTIEKTFTVIKKLNQPPIAKFDYSPTRGEVPLKVSVDATLSSDPDGNITSWEWEYIGQYVFGEKAMLTFNKVGTHDIKLTVIDNEGAKAVIEKQVIVDDIPNKPPTASFIASPKNGVVPLVVNLDASNSTDSDGEIVEYYWSTSEGLHNSGENTKMTFADVGTYTINLLVTDDKGSTDKAEQKITVTSKPKIAPIARLNISPTTGEAPLTVSLNDDGSSDEDGEIVDYTWTISNGKELSGTNTQTTFDDSGTYTIKLTVTDNDGLTSDIEKTITVTPKRVPPIANLNISPTEGNAPLTVNLDGSSSYDSDGTIVNYVWSVDGKQIDGVKTEVNFNKTGTYEITLTVTDDDGLTAKISKTITVNEAINEPPVALFTASPLDGFAPLTVNLDASKSYDEDGEIVEYSWTVDGDSVTPTDNEIVISEVGGHKITLTVTDDDGATAKKSKTVEVSDKPIEKNPDIRVDDSSLLFENTNRIIDVMVVYTPAANSDGNIRNDIDQAVKKANQAYENSKINQQIRLVHTAQVNYTESDFETDLDRLTNNDGVMDEIHQLRDKYGADLVSLWRANDQYNCGLGWILKPFPTSQSGGFNVTSKYCAVRDHTFTHELGHNMGAVHDFYVKDNEGAYSYSQGYINATGSSTNSWKTIMSYYDKCTDDNYFCKEIDYFSNPNVSYNGVSTGTATENNALTLNNMFLTVSNFRKAKEVNDTKSFTIFNEGEADLKIFSIIPENNVEWIISPIISNSATIAANSSIEIEIKVNYSLAPAGKNNVNLLITSNDPDEETVKVNVVINQSSDADMGLTTNSAKSALYDGNINNLSLDINIPDVDISYQVNLSLVSYPEKPDALVFKLDSVEELSFKIKQQISNYDAAQGIVEIPAVNVPGEQGEPQLYKAKMKLIPSNLRSNEMLFEVIETTPIEIIAVH